MLHGIMVDSFIIHVETVCSLTNHTQIVGSGKKAAKHYYISLHFYPVNNLSGFKTTVQHIT